MKMYCPSIKLNRSVIPFVFLLFPGLTKEAAHDRLTGNCSDEATPFSTAFREPAHGASRQQAKGAVSLPSRASETAVRGPGARRYRAE